MAKHDAFGREAGEDTLAEAGWRTGLRGSTAPSASPEPVASPDPVAPLVFTTGTAPRRTLRVGRFIALLVLAILAITGVAVFAVVRQIDDTIDRIDMPEIRIPTVSAVPQELPSTAAPAEPAKGLGAGSLLRPERMAGALGELRRAGGAVMHLRLAPDRIDTQLLRRNRMHIVQVGPSGDLREIASAPSSAPAAFRLDLARVDPRVPRRLLLAAERRFGFDPADVDYLVVSVFSGELSWNAYYRGNAGHVQAGPDGRITRRVS